MTGEKPEPQAGRSQQRWSRQGGSRRAGELVEQGRQTISRHRLAGSPRFAEISPRVGVLDEGAFDRALSDDTDEAIELLADLTAATDRDLAALARRLAGRLVLDIARSGCATGRGIGRLVSLPADRGDGDLDVDASLEALHTAVATATPPALDELRLRAWTRPATAICLLVDRSGSMHGRRLLTACVTAAGCAWRARATTASSCSPKTPG